MTETYNEDAVGTYNRVAQWNERCNKHPVLTGTRAYWESLSNQAERIDEELTELRKAIREHDLIEVFDALLDLDVVVAGGLYLSNGDYEGGINAVLENNDLKHTKYPDVANIAAASYTEDVFIEYSYAHETYSLRRGSDDKIMKFPGHPTVDLTPFSPKEKK